MVLLAIDFNEFVLASVAVAFSTWVVLPWAFYDGLKKDFDDKTDQPRTDRAASHLRLLRQGQGFLFLAGIFLMLYVFLNFWLQEIDSVSNGSYNALTFPLLDGILGIFGFGLLFLGLYDGFRVTTYFSGLRSEKRDFLTYAVLPIILFNMVFVIVQILIQAASLLEFNSVGWLFFGSLVVLLITIPFSIKWLDYLFLLVEGWNVRGVASVVLLVLPYAVIGIWFLAFHSGISPIGGS